MKKHAFPIFNRASGVLLNISSLPSEYGIGCFGQDAETFVDLIADMGFHWWQILPLTTIGWGNSPYSGISTNAGNRLYISAQRLSKQGLLTKEEAASFKYYGEPYSTDYDFARLNSERYLRLAFERLSEQDKRDIDAYRKKNADWLEDYALFMALSATRGSAWWKWEDELKFRNKHALAQAKAELKDELDFYAFEQFEFEREWQLVKQYANKRGVQIIGDLPFYVSTDSVDVWANAKDFQLDENLLPTAIAGVPPYALSSNGQVWGNCLYNFDSMRANDFAWWRRRIKRCFELYDAVRLDHFMAFYNYFSIPAKDFDTAKNGHWEMGPGKALLDFMLQDNPSGVFIAEDLGLIDEPCREFIDSLGIPTMKVFQFGFDGTPSSHIPYRYEQNCVAYTGTHDNNTTLGWLYEINDDARRYVLKYCGFEGAGWGAGGPECASTRAIIKTLMMSSANLVILPFQDMLGYGGDTRMNTPGVAEGNWKYRLPYHLMSTVDRNFFVDLNSTYNRFGSGVQR